MLRMYLLPALPLIRGNAVCTVEVWNILRQYETTTRWRLYGEWKGASYKSHPELRIREVQADREAKGILRRLSSNTTDSLSGAVAKLAHSNPCIFFRNAVNQIMAYDNLASVVVQAMRYVTNMGFDVLLYIILEALANGDKERLKEDGVNTADWLQSMCSGKRSTSLTPSTRSCCICWNAFQALQHRHHTYPPLCRSSASWKPDDRYHRASGADLENGWH